MELEQLLQLIDAVSESKLTDFKYEEDGVKLRLKKENGTAHAVVQAADAVNTAVFETAQTAGVPTEALSNETVVAAVLPDAEPKTDGNIVKSPLVGVFYAAPAEDAKPYVSVGDSVKKGQVLACVEAMKLMNEIESEFDGVVAEILVENGQGVGYGEPLFVIR